MRGDEGKIEKVKERWLSHMGGDRRRGQGIKTTETELRDSRSTFGEVLSLRTLRIFGRSCHLPELLVHDVGEAGGR